MTTATKMAKKKKSPSSQVHRMGNLRYDLWKNPHLFVMLIPCFAFFLVFSYAPMIGIYYAFTNFNFQAGLFGSPFVGLANFEYLFASGTAWQITANTLFYNVIFIFGGNIMQVLVAILLAEVSGKYFRKISQTIMFLPYFISYVIVGIFAYNILNYETGIYNSTLAALGLNRFDFYNTPWVWRIVIPLFHFWKSIGYGSVVYLAAIMGIPGDMYEAAEIDGANVIQQIRYITLPSLKPTFIILLLLALGGIMRGQFDLFFQLIGTNGILFSTTDIIDTYVFRSLRFNVNIGMGTAAGLYQSAFGMILVFAVNAIIRKAEPEMSLF